VRASTWSLGPPGPMAPLALRLPCGAGLTDIVFMVGRITTRR
jgi:hypothetical protein